MINKDRIKAIGRRCECGARTIVAGVCVACGLAAPGVGHASASAHQVVITRPFAALQGALGDRPESLHLPEPDFTVPSARIQREARPGSSVLAPPKAPDLRLSRRLLTGRISQPIPPPVQAPAFVPQAFRSPLPGSQLLSQPLPRGTYVFPW